MPPEVAGFNPSVVSPFMSSTTSVSSQDANTSLIDTILWSPVMERHHEDNSILVRHDNEGFEFTGPSSGISLLSNNGLRWILKKTEDEESVATLREFAEEITSHFAMPTKNDESVRIASVLRGLLNPLPSPAVAAQYIKAYFDADQCCFPLLDRKVFERQVQSHSGSASLVDIPWYALYNAVLAIGCRSARSSQSPNDNPTRLAQAEAEAEKYFYNAVRVQSELMCRRTNLETVQAFAAMTLYAQHSTTPQCEYKFCSIAVRLAQGMGIHKDASLEWDVTQVEAQERSRIFWVLYWMDKTISLRMGRPSAIDDAEVSCPFPTTLNMADDSFDFFLFAARYARICSQIISLMYSAKALISPLSQLFETAEKLEQKLRKWHDDIPDCAKLERSSEQPGSQCSVTRIQSVALEFFYHYAICAIHRRFPAQTFWQQTPCSSDQSTSDRIVEKAKKCLEASRSICLLTSHLEVQSYSPSWLLIYYPLSGVITLFTNVVADPLAPTANTDIALMEVVTGLFGKLEFCTSGSMAFTKTAELSRLARKAIKKAKREEVLEHKAGTVPSKEQSHRRASVETTQSGNPPSLVDTSSSGTILDLHRTLEEAAPPSRDTNWMDCPDWQDLNMGTIRAESVNGASFDMNLESSMQLEHGFQANGTSSWPGTWNMDLLV